MGKDFELNERQKDELKELGNIGAGRASRYLSDKVDRKIDVEVPEVRITSLSGDEDVQEIFGRSGDTKITGALLPLKDPAGVLTFTFPREDYPDFLTVLEENSGEYHNFLETSQEVSKYYLQAVETLLDIEVDRGSPTLMTMDFMALLNHSVAVLDRANSLIINTEMTLGDTKSNLALFLELEDVDQVVKSMESKLNR